MRSQRGSMAVVALVMMLFLLIAGFAWLPMLAQENKTAQNDWEEQQAWYAAEAGFVRAKTELNNSADGGDWSWLAKSASKADLNAAMISIVDDILTGTKQAKYAVYISPELSSTDAPTAATEYSITAVGQVNGMQKILKKTITTAASSGGNSGGDTPTAPDAMVAAGGKIMVHDPWMHFNSDGTIFTSTTLKVNPNSDASAGNANWWSSLANTLYTHLPDSMFVYPSGTAKGYLTYGGTLNLGAGETAYMDSLQITDWQGAHPAYSGSFNITGATGSTVYFTSAVASKLVFNGITGPSSGEPLNIIIDGDADISGLSFSGNVRIIVKGTLTLSGGNGSGNFMFLSNGNITVKQSISAIHNLFLSSDGDIKIAGDFKGQMQAKGNIDIFGVGSTYTFNGDVLKAFSLPAGMTKN
ncbi:MAG: hypothetical protein VB014_00780 [Acidaminococcaceae bacterium]|nr:hypothetical protein [Acidaminococcaceae bacterium]